MRSAMGAPPAPPEEEKPPEPPVKKQKVVDVANDAPKLYQKLANLFPAFKASVETSAQKAKEATNAR